MLCFEDDQRDLKYEQDLSDWDYHRHQLDYTHLSILFELIT